MQKGQKPGNFWEKKINPEFPHNAPVYVDVRNRKHRIKTRLTVYTRQHNPSIQDMLCKE